MTRTSEEQSALKTLQDFILPHCDPFLDEVCVDLVGKPQAEIDQELRRIGRALFRMMRDRTPQLSEAVQLGLPFAFIELARSRVALMPEAGGLKMVT